MQCASVLVAVGLMVAGGVSMVTDLFHAGQVVRAAGSQTRRVTSIDPRARYLVLIVLDGARPDYFGLTSLPNVDALRSRGTQYTRAFDGILETETPAGHTALATGSTPRRNGILGFNWAQGDNDYSLFSPDVVRSGAMERIMQQARVPTLAGLYKARYPRARVVALSGHKYYAADPLGGPQADAIMYFRSQVNGTYAPTAIPGHVPPPGVLENAALTMPTFHLKDGQDDGLATQLALAAFRAMRPRMLLINYPEFDWPLGHVYGANTNRSKTVALMQSFDRDLGLLEAAYKRAHILKKTLFVITADHGMAPLWRFVPNKVVTSAVARARTMTSAVSYSNGAYIWLRNAARASTVGKTILAAHDPGIQSVYYLSRTGGVFHYVLAGGMFANPGVDRANRSLLTTLLNGHEPTVVVFCRNHATFSSTSTHWRGDHGGASWLSQHIPLILAGPGIGRGIVTALPAELIDVAPTVLADMGVAPTGMEGHILAEALRVAATVRQRQRAIEVMQTRPLVDALAAQDQYESLHPLHVTVRGVQKRSLRGYRR